MKDLDGKDQKHPTTVFSKPAAMLTLGTLFAVNAVSLDGPLVAIPAIAEHFGVNSGQSQLILALFLLGYALGHIPSGLLGDRFGRRPVILIGMTLTALFAFLAVIAPNFEILLGARFAQGLCAATGGLLAKAMIRDVASSGTEASRLSSNALSYLAILIIIAPLLSSFFLAMFNWRAVMAIVFGYFIIVTSLTAIFIPETLNKDASQNNRSSWQQFKDSFRAFVSSPQSYSATIYGAILFSTYFIFATAGASVIVDVYGLSASYFGPVFAVIAVAQFAVSMINSRIVSKLGIFKVLTIAISFSVLAALTTAASLISGHLPLFIFVLIGFLLSLSHGLTLPNSIALTLDPLPKSAGFAASIHGMVQTGLAALVGILVSNIYNGTQENILMLFLVFALLNCLAFIGLHFIKNRNT